MISLSVNGDLVSVTVMGAFRIEDYKEFEEAALYGIKFQGVVNLLFDLRDMLSYSMDVAWEELKFSRQHSTDFGRIAVLTDDEWVAWSTWISRAFVKAEIRLFDDLEAAQAWLADAALAPA